MEDRRLEEVVRHLDPPSGWKPWHGGASVVGAVRGIPVEVAAWKPYPDRHSIWELTLHVAYWDYAVVRRLTDAPRGGFPRSPSDWPDPPAERSPAAWEDDRRLLRDWHDALVVALRELPSSLLDEPTEEGSETTRADLATGGLLHETYHAGQIQLMKRLAGAHGL